MVTKVLILREHFKKKGQDDLHSEKEPHPFTFNPCFLY